MTTEPYDSTEDTQKHRDRVRGLMESMRLQIGVHALKHDDSKLESPEKEVFDRVTPKLKAMTYGSDEYKASLKEMGPALSHHYANNSHHPEHNPNGVSGMDLIDLIEMLADWKAAGERHANGSMAKSLAHNRVRVHIDDQLFSVMENTVRNMRW